MKKTIILLTSLLALSCTLCFAGCNDKGNDENSRTIISPAEENGDTCPDCEKHGMPKVRFEFKDGRPTCKDDGVEQPERHRKPHPHPHGPHRPAPPEDNGEDKGEN